MGQDTGALVPEVLNEVQSISDRVIKYASRLDPTSLSIEKIVNIGLAGTGFVHAVHVNIDERDRYSVRNPGQFVKDGGGGRTLGRVVGQEPDGSVLYVLFERRLSEVDLPGCLEIDRGYLLSQLASQIKKLDTLPPLILPMFQDDTHS